MVSVGRECMFMVFLDNIYIHIPNLYNITPTQNRPSYNPASVFFNTTQISSLSKPNSTHILQTRRRERRTYPWSCIALGSLTVL